MGGSKLISLECYNFTSLLLIIVWESVLKSLKHRWTHSDDTAEVGLKRYFKCQDSIVFYLKLLILIMPFWCTSAANLSWLIEQWIAFSRNSLASIIMDSHLIIFQFCFCRGNLHIKLRSTSPLFKLSSWKVLCYDSTKLVFREIGNGGYFLIVRCCVSWHEQNLWENKRRHFEWENHGKLSLAFRRGFVHH